jgi:hypothetical protein
MMILDCDFRSRKVQQNERYRGSKWTRYKTSSSSNSNGQTSKSRLPCFLRLLPLLAPIYSGRSDQRKANINRGFGFCSLLRRERRLLRATEIRRESREGDRERERKRERERESVWRGQFELVTRLGLPNRHLPLQINCFLPSFTITSSDQLTHADELIGKSRHLAVDR